MRFNAFDSFEGLPEISGVDEKGFQHFKRGEHKCSEAEFKINLKKAKVDLSKVSVIPGWYDKVLNNSLKEKMKFRKASIINIDCDLYESTIPVLNFITDLLQEGTILLFDDWYCYRGDPNRGEQKAFAEWLKKNKKIKVSEYRKYGWHGNSFIVLKSG